MVLDSLHSIISAIEYGTRQAPSVSIAHPYKLVAHNIAVFYAVDFV